MKPAPPAEQDAFVSLQRAAARLMDGVAELLKPYGLSPAQYNALRILRGAHPEQLNCRQVASRMMTREPDLTRLIDRLEKAGLVRRERQPSDRRVVRIGMTPAGLALLARIDEPMLALHRLQFAVLSQKQLAAFTRMARRLYES